MSYGSRWVPSQSTGSTSRPVSSRNSRAQPVERLLAFLEEAAREVPVAAPRLDRPLREQHAAVALEHALRRPAPSSRSTPSRRPGSRDAPSARARELVRRSAGRAVQPSRSPTRQPRLREHRVGEPRPRLLRPVAEVEVGEAREREPGAPGRPRGTCRCGRSGRTCAASCARPSSAGSCRRAARARGPSRSGPYRPKPGQHAVEARELHRRPPRRASRRAMPRRLEQLARDDEQLARATPRRRSAGEPASGKPQTRSKYSANGISARAPTSSAAHLEARVRVDAPRAGLRDRRVAVERQARCVREQVAHASSRAGPAGSSRSTIPSSHATSTATAVASFVTDAQAKDAVDVAVRRDLAAPATATATCSHGQPSTCRSASTPRHYPRWIGSSSPPAPRSRNASATRAPCASGRPVWVSGTAPIMPGDADPPDDAYEQARHLPRDHRDALEQAGATLDDVVRTRIYVTSAERHRRGRPRAPRGVRRRPAGDDRGRRPGCSTRAGSSRSRPRRVIVVRARMDRRRASVLDHRFGAATRTPSASRRSTCCSTPRRGTSCSTSTRCSRALPTTASSRRVINPELMQSVLEITTPVCRTPAEVDAAAAARCARTSPRSRAARAAASPRPARTRSACSSGSASPRRTATARSSTRCSTSRAAS